MNNNDALNLIIKYHKEVIEDKFYVICDSEYNIIAEDGLSAKLANISDQTFLGKKLVPQLSQAPWRTRTVEQIIHKCIETKQSSEWLSLRFSRQQEYWLLKLEYHPLINLSTADVVGIKIVASPLKYPLYMYSIESIIEAGNQNRRNQIVSSMDGLDTLEHEILFLTYHANNYDEISEWLSLSHGKVFSKSKISRINNNLMEKFACNNVEELKMMIFKQGLHLKFPYSLVGEFMYPTQNS